MPDETLGSDVGCDREGTNAMMLYVCETLCFGVPAVGGLQSEEACAGGGRECLKDCQSE